LCEAVDAAAELGRSRDDNAGLSAAAIYFPSGLRPAARWAECVSIFSDAYAPVVEHAVRQGVRLAVEPTSWLYSDLSFVQTLEAATDIAKQSGLGVCMDLFHVWTAPIWIGGSAKRSR
jgi:sugar phosphate isomerase/epimerase